MLTAMEEQVVTFFYQVNRFSLSLQAKVPDDQLISVFCAEVCMQEQQSGLACWTEGIEQTALALH